MKRINQNSTTAIRQRKYIQLRQLIQEMDIWNYAEALQNTHQLITIEQIILTFQH